MEDDVAVPNLPHQGVGGRFPAPIVQSRSVEISTEVRPTRDLEPISLQRFPVPPTMDGHD